MATNSSNIKTGPSQFSLKHRLIGAGILISFGVLILPWMLGSYSIEHEQPSKEREEVKRETKPGSIASLVSNAGSKSTEQQRLSDSDKKSTSETKTTADDKSEVKVFKSRVQPIESIPKEQAKPKNKQTVDQTKQATPNKSASDKQKVVKKIAADSPKKQVTTKVPEKKAPEKKAIAPNTKNTSVKRGYIVSVGVFGDVQNVEKMVADLKSKKFVPEVRKETFNEKSVSRIFMGPYNTRAEAGKVKLRLSEKGISKTLIKTFP